MDDDIVILFNINNLITGKIKKQLAEQKQIIGQVRLLFDLIDFEDSEEFSDDEKTEINDFYMAATQESYEAPYIAKDTKAVIEEYALTVKDIEKVKKLINDCCHEDFRESAVDNAVEAVNKIKAEKAAKFYDDIDLEFISNTKGSQENTPPKNKKTQSLKNLLAAAQEKIKK